MRVPPRQFGYSGCLLIAGWGVLQCIISSLTRLLREGVAEDMADVPPSVIAGLADSLVILTLEVNGTRFCANTTWKDATGVVHAVPVACYLVRDVANVAH
jgi:hypothetical protein